MVMQAMHSGRGSGILKFFFFSLLVLAAGGLVLTDVGGFFSGGVSSGNVAEVGQEKISIQAFDRTTRRMLARMGMSPQQALEMGYMDRILDGEVRRLLFQQIAEDQGIRLSKPMIAKKINEMIQAQPGSTDNPQAVFDQLLMNQGYTEPEFVSIVAGETAAGLLGRAVQNKYLGNSDALARDLYQANNEKRSLDIVAFPHTEYTSAEKPSEEQIAKLYEAVKESFASPENRTISVGVIQDETVKSTIDITEESVRARYDDEIEAFKVPEEREIEQAILDTESDATKVQEELKSGKSLKDAVQSVTGKDSGYIASQNYQKEGLITEISDLVFSGEDVGKTYGPVKSALGWHILNLKKINAPHTKSFDEVRTQIESDMLENEFADRKYELAAEVDDMLAGGATPEDISKDIELEIIPVNNVTAAGAMAEVKHDLDVFGENATTVSALAMEYSEGESSPVSELPDGRMIFVHIDKIIPKSYKPLEEVRAELEARWLMDQQRMNNRQNVDEILKNALVEEKALESIAKDNGKTITAINGITKNEELPAPLSPASFGIIFNAEINTPILIEIEGGVAIAQVTAISLPETGEQAAENIAEIKATNIQDAGEESITSYFENKRGDYKVQLNNRILEQVYGANSQF